MVCKVSVREVRIMEEVRAPIPGKILAIKCKVNDFIKPGQVLLILEAMKMENEICSDSSGVVKEVKVKEGDFVQSGFTLIVIGEGKNKN